MPRNVHRSAINALIISGATPVYVNPGVDNRLGIPLGMSMKDLETAVEKNPDAKAILVNNPTYYGVCSDVRRIVELAHKHGMKVLCDEAHGTHFYFGDDLPISAMKANADMAAVSTHKTGGSLTQSSLLLINNDINEGYVRQIINLTSTTSASYLLLSSLDITRSNLALNGKKIYETVLEYVRYAREEINKIGGYEAVVNDLTIKNNSLTKENERLSQKVEEVETASQSTIAKLEAQVDELTESKAEEEENSKRLIAELKEKHAKEIAELKEKHAVELKSVSDTKERQIQAIYATISEALGETPVEEDYGRSMAA